MRIYKYPLELTSGHQRVPMPKGAKPLAFQMQGDTPTLWAEVDPSAETGFMVVQIVATGEEPPRNWAYYGTVLTRGGLVFHLYIMPGHGIISWSPSPWSGARSSSGAHES